MDSLARGGAVITEDDDDVIRVGAKDVVKESTHWLELFDKNFARKNTPFPRRPLNAAIWLVNDGILQVIGGTKENFWEQPWFSEIVVGIRAWYQDRYGSEHFEPENDALGGLVVFRGTPVRLNIPTTVSKVEIENETAWLIFADSVHESEDVLSFFASKPNLTALAPADRVKLEASVTATVARSRRINLVLHSASTLNPKGERLREVVWLHIEQALDNILLLKPERVSYALSELHFAVEKTFKVFLHQQGHTNLAVFGHDLAKLDEAATAKDLVVSRDALAKLPKWKAAIGNRYAEHENMMGEVVEIYDLALQLMDEITRKMQRDYVVNNAGFLLKKPAWVGRK